MDPTLTFKLTKTFNGLKRTCTQRIADGEGRIKVGKDPLPFGLYRFLARTFLQQSSKEFIFGHSFLVICWNLMSRSANAFAVKHDHMEWREDALCIYFAHMKNDQTGERPRDPRHIYPNPIRPEICPVLSLGLYWLTNAFDPADSSLFPGKNQYDRFRKLLARAIDVPAVVEELERRSINPDDLGTHSMRKGAATYCSSGSTGGPSSSAIHLRAGWAMGGVQDSYIRYEAAGDMYVGRVVSGLPLEKAEFDVVGPVFAASSSTVVLEHVRRIFPNLPASLTRIAEHALASLVYHSDFIEEVIPTRHPVRQSQLFRDRTVLENLKPLVKCSLKDEVDIAPTGIPPHTSMLRELTKLRQSVDVVVPEVRTSSVNTIDGIIAVLEERAIGAGTVTRDGVAHMLEEQMSRLMAILESGPQVRRPSPEAESAAASEEDVQSEITFDWDDGSTRMLPQDYELPAGTVEMAFQAWILPDTRRRIRALRRCSPRDMATDNNKRRFGDLSSLMGRIEQVAREKDIFTTIPTSEQVRAMFRVWEEEVQLSSVTPKGRQRRIGQLKWTSVLKILRTRVE